MLESSQATCSTVASLVKGNSGRFNASNMNWCGRGLVVSPGTRAYAVPTRSLYLFQGPPGRNLVKHSSKVWMKGFLPSQWYMPVSTLLPVSKVLSFSPPQRSWFPSRIPGKFSHIRRISQGQILSQSEGSRSRLQK